MKRAGQKDVVILAAKRTPFGTFGGALKDLTRHRPRRPRRQGGARAGRRARRRTSATSSSATSLQTSADAIYLARHVGLRAGAAASTSRRSRVNRLCGSGFEAVIQAAMLIDRRGRGRARRRHRVHEPGAATSSAARASASRSASAGARGHALEGAHRQLRRHADGDHRREPRRAVPDRPGRGGRVRGPLPAALGRRARGGPLPRRDRAGRARRGRRARSSFDRDEHPRPETTVEGLAQAAQGLQEGRRHPRRRRERHLRRRGRARRRDARVRGAARASKPLARLVNWGVAGVRPDHHGHRPGAGDPERARARRRDARRHRPLRGERGVRARSTSRWRRSSGCRATAPT